MHPLFKQSVVSPLLIKSTLDNDQLSNYRPISNLFLISKIVERVVKYRLTDHLYSHGLLNPHQSAYRRHHSTITSLLYIHDHLITDIALQKLFCLCLLDLSAAFDTIDHDILLTRLSSWFGIHGYVLNWFKSYLSSRTFCVKCNDCFSFLHTSLYGVPQGSVLGPLFFIMYTTPLSTLISSLSLHRHLYADDTQLFLSFHPSDFQASISRHQNALTQISSWLTSNLLSLKSSKTEFLLIGLKRQLSKIHNSSTSIDITQSVCNLGFIFDEHLSFSDQISALSKSCYHHIRALRCIRPYLDLHTAKTVAAFIVHPKLDYCNSLYYGLPKFQINRLQHIQNALARTVVQAPKFKHITLILKSLHWLKVSERIEYRVICLTYKILNTTQPSYLYDLVSIQPPHGHNTRSSPHVTVIKPSSSLKVTHRSLRHASPHLWNHLLTSLKIPHPRTESFIPLSATFI